jgi:uncharacterized protein (TIGR02246 family)
MTGTSAISLDAEDSFAILQLVARADACATARDPDGYVALFTEDAVMDGAMGTAHGKTALRKAVAQVWALEPAGTRHLTLNALIDTSGSEVRVDSVMLMIASGASPAIVGSATVHQVVTRRSEGWRISRRTICTT